MNDYIDPHGSVYRIYETDFVNPSNGTKTVLFVLINESNSVLQVSTASWDVDSWVRSFDLTLRPSPESESA